MHKVAASILDCVMSGNFDVIPEDHWRMLASFLSGEHRGKQGRKFDRELNEQCDKDILSAYENMLSSGMKPNAAQEALASREHLEVRSIQRACKRAKERKELEKFAEKLGKEDMTRFFKDDA